MHCLSLPPTVSPPRSERSTQGASLRHIRCRSAPAASHCLSPVVRALHPGGEPPKQEVQVSSSAVRALHAGGEVSKLRAFGVRAESPLHFLSLLLRQKLKQAAGMTWYQLKIVCPVKDCPGNQRMISWVCVKDGGTMYICEEGLLRCESNAHKNLIIHWKFDCGDRTGPHKSEHFQSPDYEKFTHAMALALPHLPMAGADWVCTLVKNLEAQFKH